MPNRIAIATEPNPQGSQVYNAQEVVDLGYKEGYAYALSWSPGRPQPAALTSQAEIGNKYNAEYVRGYKEGWTDGIAQNKTAKRKTAGFEDAKCPVCGGDADMWSYLDGKPCMACIKARARSAQDSRCHCGRKAIPGTPNQYGRVKCERCLGAIAPKKTSKRKTSKFVHPDTGVVEIDDDDPDLLTNPNYATCGTCGRTWDDSVSTSWTPTPGGRCPFEYEHEDDDSYYASKRKKSKMSNPTSPRQRVTRKVAYKHYDHEATKGGQFGNVCGVCGDPTVYSTGAGVSGSGYIHRDQIGSGFYSDMPSLGIHCNSCGAKSDNPSGPDNDVCPKCGSTDIDGVDQYEAKRKKSKMSNPTSPRRRRRQASEFNKELSELDQTVSTPGEFKDTTTPSGAADVANVPSPEHGYPQPSSSSQEPAIGEQPGDDWVNREAPIDPKKTAAFLRRIQANLRQASRKTAGESDPYIRVINEGPGEFYAIYVGPLEEGYPRVPLADQEGFASLQDVEDRFMRGYLGLGRTSPWRSAAPGIKGDPAYEADVEQVGPPGEKVYASRKRPSVSRPARKTAEKFEIKDWMGNTCFGGETFDSFEEGWDYIYANDPEPDQDSPEWQDGWNDDYYVQPVGTRVGSRKRPSVSRPARKTAEKKRADTMAINGKGYDIGPGADLAEANLNGADLSGADLSFANLYYANFRGANLRGANLTGADLDRANLDGANLTGADLTRADLTEADLTGADLTGANLYRANLVEADLSFANLYGANLTEADLTGADLIGADLNRADLSGVTISSSTNIDLPPEWKIDDGKIVKSARKTALNFGSDETNWDTGEVILWFNNDEGLYNMIPSLSSGSDVQEIWSSANPNESVDQSNVDWDQAYTLLTEED